MGGGAVATGVGVAVDVGPTVGMDVGVAVGASVTVGVKSGVLREKEGVADGRVGEGEGYVVLVT